MHYPSATEKTKKCHTRNNSHLRDNVIYMHGDALKRNTNASKHSQPCPIKLWSPPLHQKHTSFKKKYQICSCRNSIFVQLHKTPTMRKKRQEEDTCPWFLRKVLSKHKCKKVHQGICALVGSVVFHINKNNCHHTKYLQGQSEAWLEPMGHDSISVFQHGIWST